MSIKDTVQALLELDDQVLDAEKIQKLQKISPNGDEMEKLLSYKGNLSELSNIEQFLIQLLQVPSLNERLECMLFKNKFDYEYTEMNKNLTTLDSAVKGIRDNNQLKEIFAMILKIGNYLNYGTAKGNQQGFSMDLLS
jgi:diaphanous 1